MRALRARRVGGRGPDPRRRGPCELERRHRRRPCGRGRGGGAHHAACGRDGPVGRRGPRCGRHCARHAWHERHQGDRPEGRGGRRGAGGRAGGPPPRGRVGGLVLSARSQLAQELRPRRQRRRELRWTARREVRRHRRLRARRGGAAGGRRSHRRGPSHAQGGDRLRPRRRSSSAARARSPSSAR